MFREKIFAENDVENIRVISFPKNGYGRKSKRKTFIIESY